MDMSVIEDRKARARAWFERLRDDICESFEQLEDDAPGSLYPGASARFVRTPWDRNDPSGKPGGQTMRRRCVSPSAITLRPARIFQRKGNVAACLSSVREG